MKGRTFFEFKNFFKKIQNTEYENEIKNISEKIIENRVILFLGAGFSCNFGLPNWEELNKEIISRAIKMNEKKNFSRENQNLTIIQDSMSKQSLSSVLDIILDNIPDLNGSGDRKTFLMNVYKDNLSFKKYIMSNDSSEAQKISLNIRILIDNIFNKIITLNYDDIFDYRDNKDIKVKWKYIDNRISSPNQKFNKWVYPIHGSIVNNTEKSLPIIDTFWNFIENWRDSNFLKEFHNLLKNSINENYIFLFIGCSFSDNFLLNEIAAFIHKNKFFNKEEILFFVLWDDIFYDKKDKKYKIDKGKFPPLSRNWGSVKFINLSQFSDDFKNEINSKPDCVTNFFDYINFCIRQFKEKSALLNDLTNVKFSEFFEDEFGFETYFGPLFSLNKIEIQNKLMKLSNKEIIFILSFYSQKRFLLKELKKEFFNNLYCKFMIVLWEFVINNKLGDIEIVDFISNSEIFIEIISWVQTNSNQKLLFKLGEIYNV